MQRMVMELIASCCTWAVCIVGCSDPAVAQVAWDAPFSKQQFLIHLTGTSTTSGFVPKNAYLLIGVQPQNGVWITADGSGGTFSNRVELIAGPLYTPRAVCAAAAGLPVQQFRASGSNTAFNCAQAAGSQGLRTGVRSFFENLSTAGKALVVGGAVILAWWLWTAFAGGAATAASETAAAEGLSTRAAQAGLQAAVEEEVAGLGGGEIGAQLIGHEQRVLLKEFFDSGVKGALRQIGEFTRPPPGLTERTLRLYAEIAKRQIVAGLDETGAQAARLALITKALNWLKNNPQ
jgi:hypothetical protein